MGKPEQTGNARLKKIQKFFRFDAWVVLLDIIAVNVSYLIALFVRFYVNGEFRTTVFYYQDYYWRFAPFYTVVTILIFTAFKLYGGMWRYAGVNDMNRIITANLISIVWQIAGSMISLALIPASERYVNRMPFSYYIIGGLLQTLFVILIRFSYRFILVEKTRIASYKVHKVPALVVGSEELARKLVKHLEHNTVFRAVAVVGKEEGRMIDGIPIILIDSIEKTIQDMAIKAVFIADRELSNEEREKIRKAAEGLELDDFTGYMSNQSGFLPLTNLLEVVDMPIVLEIDGKEYRFSSAQECLSSLPGEYDVFKVKAERLVLKKREEDTGWMTTYKDQTGNDVSFF